MKQGLFLVILFIFSSLHAVVVPSLFRTGDSIIPYDDTYYKYDLEDENIEIIYTKDNLPFAKHTVNIEKQLNDDYEKFFNWKFDEKLYVGLISDKNQIANGFSSQWPNNRQINYIGGTTLVDYFSNTSWLDGLLFHETTHNYQLNTKASGVSQTLHSIFGNGSFLFPIPWVIVPNIVENSFMLEGNAVLNESWHGTGGRLYNGRFKAMMMLQAKAGNITPENMYNATLEFPYSGDIYYHIGGFFNLYLAKNYGIKKVDSYFYNNSRYWAFPFFTNNAMQESVGSDFEINLKKFSDKYAALAQNLVIAEGERVASSQFYMPMGSDNKEIFFLTNETAYRLPELIVIDKASESLKKDRDSWMSGKVIKVDNKYYTQGSNHTSPWKITQGLYDREVFLKKGTDSKMVQGYLSDGRTVYFDVASSYDYPKLYVGSEYYGYTNSSVIIDKNDNIYYFANENKGKKRTLYKNKTPLYTYEGFYGIVADVDSDGSVYFIANSKLGSTLYRYKEGKVTRASKADNILEARLLNDREVLVSAVSEKDYYYVKSNLEEIAQEPFNTKLFFEDKEYYKQYSSLKKEKDIVSLERSDEYYSFLNMHYSGADFSFGQAANDEWIGSLNLSFSDPLTQNSFNLFFSRDDSSVSILGVGYENSQYFVQYSVSAYGVLEDGNQNDIRSNGIIASATLPFFQSGYYDMRLGTTYFQDYDTAEREPLSATITLSRAEHHGTSMYYNSLARTNIYAVKERSDHLYGGELNLAHELGAEFYIQASAKYSMTHLNINNRVAQLDSRGVKVSSFGISDMDSATLVMPTIDNDIYFKRAGYADIGFSKVFNFSSYWFTFPFSLQRESFYTRYRFYNFEKFDTSREETNEIMAGIRFDIVVFNKGAIPFSFEYYHTDNSDISKDESQLKILLGISF